MNKFDKLYNEIILELSQNKLRFKIDKLYNVPNDLISEETDKAIVLAYKLNPSRSLCIFEETVICEDVYFQKWDVNESCINAVNNILQKILSNYKNSNDVEDLELKYPIKKLLNEIDYSTLSNYKNFHNFLDLMKENATGFITISIGKSNEKLEKDSFYEPPVKFGYRPKNGMIVDSYYQYIEDITKDCETWHDIIQKIMNELFLLQDFGTINISSLMFHRNEEVLKAAIAHEVSHFIKFLIRVNGLNYNYGLNYSRKDLDYKDKRNYFSKPDEWKELAATYIEELRIMFDELKIDHSYNNSIKFINSIFKFVKIPYNKCFNEDEYVTFILDFNKKHFHRKEIQEFIKTTYENSKLEQSYRNTWKVFIKFIFNEFKRRYKIFDMSKCLYHATYRPLLKSITKHGLGNEIYSKRMWSDSKPGVVYLAKDKDVAESYAESSEKVKEEWLDEIVILKIDIDDLDKTKLKIDENVKENQGDTLEYHGIIKKFDIEN